MKLRRIDSELVRRGLARSRVHAQEMISARRVLLDGEVVDKPARQMDPAQAIVITENDDPDYVSRGAFKLAGALDALGERAPRIQGRRCLDAGASTGGFTDVLLRRGAAQVVAVGVATPIRSARRSSRSDKRSYPRTGAGRTRTGTCRGGFVLHFPHTGASGSCGSSGTGCRFPADGETPVRNWERTFGQRWCCPRPGSSRGDGERGGSVRARSGAGHRRCRSISASRAGR